MLKRAILVEERQTTALQNAANYTSGADDRLEVDRTFDRCTVTRDPFLFELTNHVKFAQRSRCH